MPIQYFHGAQGEIKYIDEISEESLLETPIELTEWVANIFFDIKHDKKEGHIIAIKVTQGVVPTGNHEKVILVINSESKFKLYPYNDNIFKKPLSKELIEFLAGIAKIALAHNGGMFCVIKDEYGLQKFQPKAIHDNDLKRQIHDQVNRFLLN